MEALTLGVPVVAPAVGGLPQVVTDGENGLLVTPGARRAGRRASSAIVLDARLSSRLAAGAAAAGRRFSSAHAVERIEAIYPPHA